jgi:hypothetical protein
VTLAVTVCKSIDADVVADRIQGYIGREDRRETGRAEDYWISLMQQNSPGISPIYLKSLLFVLSVLLEIPIIAQNSQLMPPSQSIAPAIATADSGIKSSGVGKHWSKWYSVGVGKAPRGYTVQTAQFWLTGARSCGALAECRELARSDQRVLWEFRIRGNDQLGAATKVLSQGHIRVTYRPR